MENKNDLNLQIKNAISEATNDYVAMGFMINNSSEEFIKNLSRALLINPKEQIVRVERVSISPNQDYNFEYLSEAHEYPVEERIRISPILIKYSTFEANLESDELTKDEKNQVKNSAPYKVIFNNNSESEPSAE